MARRCAWDNFCAAIGPDFKHGMVDTAPTGNADVAPTAAEILGQPAVAGITGRVLREALMGRAAGPRLRAQSVTATTAHRRACAGYVTLALTCYAGAKVSRRF